MSAWVIGREAGIEIDDRAGSASSESYDRLAEFPRPTGEMLEMDVEFEVKDGIAVITINRPDKRNSVNQAVAEGIAAAIEKIADDPDIRVGIVTGKGGHFCAGMDLKAFLKGEVVRTPKGGFAGIAQAKLEKPIIAAVEGFALAGGFEIALACDFIVASEDAKVGLPEVKRGLVANAGGLLRLPQQIPSRIAAEMILTGEIYTALDLAPYGIFNRLVPAGRALEEALDLARKISANGPLAVAASRRVLRESGGWPMEEVFERQFGITAPVFKSNDAREGAAAFAEKRQPLWSGT